MLSKSQVLEETIAYYTEDPNRRAVTELGTCKYFMQDGRMCAVGRYLKNPERFNFSGGARALFSDKDFGILKDDYQIEDTTFWVDLQLFHDNYPYWNEKGLTEKGKEEVSRLKQKYEN